jgi:uncharacterized protein (TIGR02145 family)
MHLKKNNKESKNRVVIYLFAVIGIIFSIHIACRKVLPQEVPSLVTINISDITSASLTSGGLVFSAGGDSVLSKGICVSTEPDPEISDTRTVDGAGTGSFTSTISGLIPGTAYYIRAYATNNAGTGYGNQYYVKTTGGSASVTTTAISSITPTTAVSGGNITSDGGSAVTDRGVCWSTSPGPTTANSITSDGTGTGIFTSAITALTPGITYYVRAYATTGAGTFYGNEVTFKTECNLPAAPGAISGNTNVAANATGVVYSISPVTDATGYTWTVPTGAAITSGQGTTAIIVDFGTTGGDVSVRSENSCGNSLYTDLTITAILFPNCGTVSDIDGNVYNTVTIGTQCWLAENLKTTRYRNGDPIINVTDGAMWSTVNTGAYCWYNNDETAFKATYGALYNWYAVGDSRFLCPTGWHVPTDGEWTTLTDYLGGISAASGKLKESGTSHWNSPNDGSTNETGFTALPGGYRRWSDGTFYSIGDNGTWWSSSKDDSYNSWSRAMTNYGTTDVQVISNNNGYGISVRCLKDN